MLGSCISCITWASSVVQLVKNLPAMQETWVCPWVGKIRWRRKWQSTPVLLPGESYGQRSWAGHSSGDPKELDMNEKVTFTSLSYTIEKKNSARTLTSTVQTHVVQGSTVHVFPLRVSL